jgi:hypothetical protein
MISTLKRILFPFSILIGLAFILFIINQVSGIYLLLKEYNPTFALFVLVILSIVMLGLAFWPIALFVKLPSPIKFPESIDEEPVYQKKLLHRLRTNKVLMAKNAIPKNASDLPSSIEILKTEANKVIFSTANAVFLTTSVSQNGKLDAITILATQSTMVWKIAHIYYQRPTLRQLAYLYANVGAASFLAAELEEIDITQQLEPVIKSFFNNAAGKSIPVIGPTAHMVMDSLLQGATNSFLTLRVGNITCTYCASPAFLSRKQIKNNALKEAARQLKKVISDSSGQIVSSIIAATKKAGVDTLKSTWEGVKNTGSKIGDTIVETGKKVNPFAKTTVKE